MFNINYLVYKIREKQATLGLIGIGYVGSAIGISAASEGLKVIGYGRSLKSVERIKKLNIAGFNASNDIRKALGADVICICVPTPIAENKTPDLSSLKDSLYQVMRHLKKGQLIIIESSIAPGTTRNIALPLLEKSGFKVEKDFFLAFSPERIDPGNSQYQFHNIAKIVGGIGKKSAYLAYQFYRHIVSEVYLVSSVETAEMSKMLENSFRLINISFINEISEYTKRIGIDIWEVIAAANTKPFGFMPHYPGVGVGGHCIPVDPYYILEDAKRYGVKLNMIDIAGQINEEQPIKVVNSAVNIIKLTNGVKKEHSVLLLGVTYKPDVEDIRESPASAVLRELEQRGVSVSYFDPHIKEFESKKSIVLSERVVKTFDLIIIVTPHTTGINYLEIASFGVPILDTKNTLKSINKSNIYSFFSLETGPSQGDESRQNELEQRRKLDYALLNAEI